MTRRTPRSGRSCSQRSASLASSVGSSFATGSDIFHSIECEDYDRAIAELARLPVNQRWQAEMAQYTQVAHDYSGASSDRLLLIFNAG